MKAKKVIITSAISLGLIAVIVGAAAFAVYKTAESKSIGGTKAEQIALADANVSVSDARFRKTDFNFDDGNFVYDIEFYTDDAEYEYTISAKNGEILERDSDVIRQSENNIPDTSATFDNNINNADNNDSGSLQSETDKTEIGIEAAKNIALDDAGLTADEVTFLREKLDREDNVRIYDIEFYTSDTEYDYEINAETGAIYSRDVEKNFDKNHFDDVTENTNYIGVDKAKEIALSNVNLTANDVTFTKAKLERDDGADVYEIEFYSGKMEYEYRILAADGSIREYDVDWNY